MLLYMHLPTFWHASGRMQRIGLGFRARPIHFLLCCQLQLTANDGYLDASVNNPYSQAFERLVRKLLKFPNKPAGEAA